MTLDEARDFYCNMIELLIKEYDFDSFLEKRQQDTWEEWYESHYDCFPKFMSHCFFEHGMTKAVIGDSMTGYIIKIPFANLKNNYCEWEVKNYKAAVERGLEECFAWCDKLETFHHVPIYIMEYAECNEEDFDCYVSETYPELAEEYDGMCSDEDCVDCVLEEEWGSEIWNAFLDLADDMGITDRHGGNIGKIDGKYVLVDYSGYFG